MVDGHYRLLFVGVLPGPSNGMTLMTEVMLERFERGLVVDVVDIGDGFSSPGRSWTIKKAISTLRSVGTILRWRKSEDAAVYLVSNSSWALWLTLLQVAAVRVKGVPLLLHHHTTRSLQLGVMRMIDIAAPDDTVHIMSTPELVDMFHATVGAERRCHVLTPSLMTHASRQGCRHRSGNSFNIGHLSNLSVDKGLARVIATHRRLRSEQLDVTCHLAGRPTTDIEKQLIDRALNEFPNSLIVHGPLYGEEKDAFFRDLDAFLFPSQYANESWAIVIDEALAHGVPVVTAPFPGAERVVEPAGRVVDADEFSSRAAEICKTWMLDPASHTDARRASHALADELHNEAAGQTDELIRQLTSSAAS